MAFKYIDKIKDLIDVIEKEEKENMEKATEIIVKAILNKKAIFSFGASHAGILTEELYYRAGGLVVINPIFARNLMLDTSPITMTSEMERLEGYGTTVANKTNISEGDIVIVHSVSGRNPVSIEMAIESKKKGATVICITNLSYSKDVSSRHSSGKNLYQVSDIVIDNHGEKGDACVEISGLNQKVSPTSTVAAVTIMNSIIAEATELLVKNGMDKPPIFYSANIDGGDELNKKIFEEYRDVIHYQY
ncbi:SIS domain-containing protein [Clostridium tertium]|uniref:SIS domain-containing protein n=1 Tax=Clostridium tertium TaxID=1559 RepID=UPI001AE53C9A|nr:SIS domain-containing protein [Clostridium tertium]MBP1868357.1 putative phosphosugar-binding protein [Clostridium tertium]MDB1921680.1 SIS domain-containing protein [Clostridium tertium]MDB1924884.1 SIS domain-containing protein [Clostridium tertium]MDB1929522.1 SIS domain-containing protein [Clostridium tertium]